MFQKDEIYQQQKNWVERLRADEKGYHEDNLFLPLSEETLRDFRDGDGRGA